MKNKRVNNMKWYVYLICVLVVVATLIFGVVKGMNKEYMVGKNINLKDVSEFYYTYSATTNPAEYERYHFYIENSKYMFFHQIREADHLPLTEEDAIETQNIELTDEQWQQFFSYLEGGKVTKRTESIDTGTKTSLYLYWNKDKAKYNEFTFETYTKNLEFKKFCNELIGK